jgi:hypothetical protein
MNRRTMTERTALLNLFIDGFHFPKQSFVLLDRLQPTARTVRNRPKFQ